MSPFAKVRQLGYDLLSLGCSLTEIKNMDVKELDYWAEVKRQMDEAERIESEKVKNAGK